MSDSNFKSEKLEHQIERSELFTHTVLSYHSTRINEIESFLYGLVDMLVKKGIATPEEIKETVAEVRQELQQKEEDCHPNLALRIESDNESEFIPVNCEERLPICQAICCKLEFALSATEVENGQIKWDLGRPYFIRHEQDGYCTHNNRDNKCCNIYEHRPSVCKKYSCAKDERIWKDFEKMELNHEWINSYSQERKPKLIP